jgi:hypothetical protein
LAGAMSPMSPILASDDPGGNARPAAALMAVPSRSNLPLVTRLNDDPNDGQSPSNSNTSNDRTNIDVAPSTPSQTRAFASSISVSVPESAVAQYQHPSNHSNNTEQSHQQFGLLSSPGPASTHSDRRGSAATPPQPHRRAKSGLELDGEGSETGSSKHGSKALGSTTGIKRHARVGSSLMSAVHGLSSFVGE